MSKPLTEAQKRRLETLAERQAKADSDLQEFVAYLADEHDAPSSDGWVIRNIEEGFTQENAPQNGEVPAEVIDGEMKEWAEQDA